MHRHNKKADDAPYTLTISSCISHLIQSARDVRGSKYRPVTAAKSKQTASLTKTVSIMKAKSMCGSMECIDDMMMSEEIRLQLLNTSQSIMDLGC